MQTKEKMSFGVVWTNEMDALLSTMNLSQFALKFNISYYLIWKRRKFLGLLRSKKPKAVWTKLMVSKLDKMTAKAFKLQFNVSLEKIYKKRAELKKYFWTIVWTQTMDEMLDKLTLEEFKQKFKISFASIRKRRRLLGKSVKGSRKLKAIKDYEDYFYCLSDIEISKLTRSTTEMVKNYRQQINVDYTDNKKYFPQEIEALFPIKNNFDIHRIYPNYSIFEIKKRRDLLGIQSVYTRTSQIFDDNLIPQDNDLNFLSACLSNSCSNYLKIAGIFTIEDLKKSNIATIRKINGLGATSIAQIKRMMEHYQIEFNQ